MAILISLLLSLGVIGSVDEATSEVLQSNCDLIVQQDMDEM